MTRLLIMGVVLATLLSPAHAGEKVVCMTDAPNTERMSVAERVSLIAYLIAHRPVMEKKCSDIEKYDHMIVELTFGVKND
jgi:hypothetical protein